MGKVRFNRLSHPSRQWGITCGAVPRRCQGGATKGTEGAKIEQGSGGKDETWESRKLGNGHPDRPIHFGPRKMRNDAKENPDLNLKT
jgi:hypothetical protein